MKGKKKKRRENVRSLMDNWSLARLNAVEFASAGRDIRLSVNLKETPDKYLNNLTRPVVDRGWTPLITAVT